MPKRQIPKFFKQFWFLPSRFLPRYDYICPSCKKVVPKKSNACPYCSEHYGVPLRVPSNIQKDFERLDKYVHTKIFPRLSVSQRIFLSKFFSLAIDGTPQASNSGNTQVTSISETISTSGTADVIVAIINLNGSATITMSDGSSLITWINGTTTPSITSTNKNGDVYLQIFIGTTTSQLSSDSVTASWSGSSRYAAMDVFAISGANTSSPLDSTPGTSCTGNGGLNSLTSQTSSSFSTGNANDMIIYALGLYTGGFTESWTPGAIAGTTATLCGDTTALGEMHLAAEYLVVSSKENSVTAAISWNTSAYDAWAVFAIQAAAPVVYVPVPLGDGLVSIVAARKSRVPFHPQSHNIPSYRRSLSVRLKPDDYTFLSAESLVAVRE
jgi:hypothetical protein